MDTILFLRPAPVTIEVITETAELLVIPAYKMHDLIDSDISVALNLFKRAAQILDSQIGKILRVEQQLQGEVSRKSMELARSKSAMDIARRSLELERSTSQDLSRWSRELVRNGSQEITRNTHGHARTASQELSASQEVSRMSQELDHSELQEIGRMPQDTVIDPTITTTTTTTTTKVTGSGVDAQGVAQTVGGADGL